MTAVTASHGQRDDAPLVEAHMTKFEALSSAYRTAALIIVFVLIAPIALAGLMQAAQFIA
jgi:hypothetical protein